MARQSHVKSLPKFGAGNAKTLSYSQRTADTEFAAEAKMVTMNVQQMIEKAGAQAARSTFGVILATALFTTITTRAASANFGSQTYAPRPQNVVGNVQQRANVQQRRAGTQLASASQASPVSQNALPATTLDSFVKNAGGSAETIYGDEGTTSVPPYYGFSYQHRINAGITGARDTGLTTGHGSMMPSAWGADEFLAPPGEQSLSGTNGGNPQTNNADAALNAADQTEASSSVLSNNSSSSSANQGTPTTPSPGPGYYPIFMCGGVFAGWMSPAEVALGQTDWGAALTEFANSGACDPTCALELLVETGNATPAQQAAMNSAALLD
jgi:hypothetical protein